MISLSENRLRWFGPIILFVFGNFFFRATFWLTATPLARFHSALVGLIAGYVFWELNRGLIQHAQQTLPGLDRTGKRIWLWLVLLPLLVNAAVFMRFGMHIRLGARPGWWLGAIDYITSFGIQLFYHVVYFSVYEGRYVMQQWKRTYQEKELLAKAQWQTRFNSLKNQVNPHFLFNSLNALSALIDESPAQASRFVDELSSMYRYLLRSNEEELVSLHTELTFLESYAHLLETRFGGGLRVQRTVSEHQLAYRLPPLTLQRLVENAVKHNITLPDHPLCVEISSSAPGQLPVRNNRQHKPSRALSNGVGLGNILSKYQMLGRPALTIEETDGYFTVTLPLSTKS